MATIKFTLVAEVETDRLNVEELVAQLQALGIVVQSLHLDPPAERSLQEIFDHLDKTDHELYKKLA